MSRRELLASQFWNDWDEVFGEHFDNINALQSVCDYIKSEEHRRDKPWTSPDDLPRNNAYHRSQITINPLKRFLYEFVESLPETRRNAESLTGGVSWKNDAAWDGEKFAFQPRSQPFGHCYFVAGDFIWKRFCEFLHFHKFPGFDTMPSTQFVKKIKQFKINGFEQPAETRRISQQKNYLVEFGDLILTPSR